MTGRGREEEHSLRMLGIYLCLVYRTKAAETSIASIPRGARWLDSLYLLCGPTVISRWWVTEKELANPSSKDLYPWATASQVTVVAQEKSSGRKNDPVLYSLGFWYFLLLINCEKHNLSGKLIIAESGVLLMYKYSHLICCLFVSGIL